MARGTGIAWALAGLFNSRDVNAAQHCHTKNQKNPKKPKNMDFFDFFDEK
jgi:hypothetical protein